MVLQSNKRKIYKAKKKYIHRALYGTYYAYQAKQQVCVFHNNKKHVFFSPDR